MPKLQKRVATYGRGGVIVKLPVLTTKPIYGKLLVVDGSERHVAEYWRLHVKDDGREREYLVGKRGEFYIDDLPSGRFPAKAVFDDRVCHFSLDVPSSEDVTVNMGEVICEMG